MSTSDTLILSNSEEVVDDAFTHDLETLQIQVEDAWEMDLKLTRLSTEVEAGNGAAKSDSPAALPAGSGRAGKAVNGGTGEIHLAAEEAGAKEGELARTRSSRDANFVRYTSGGSVATQLDDLIGKTIAKVDSATPSSRKAGAKTPENLNTLRRRTIQQSESDSSSSFGDANAHVSAELGVAQNRPSSNQSERSMESENNVKARWAKATWYATQLAAERNRDSGRAHDPGLHRASSNGGSAGSFFQRNQSTEVDTSTKRFAMNRFLNSRPMHAVVIATTTYALFFHDVYFLAQASPHGDYPLFSCTFAVACIFTLELALRSLAQHGYFLSHIFWLDLVAIVSFVPDIAWWAKEFDLIGLLGNLTIARAGRAARAGARAARIIRAMGYMRKLLHLSAKAGEEEEEQQESVHDFGKNLGAIVSKVLIAVVAVMLILSTISTAIASADPRVDWELKALAGAYVDGFGSDVNDPGFKTFIDNWVQSKEDSTEPVLLVEIDGEVVWGSQHRVDDVRPYPSESMRAELSEFRSSLLRCTLVVSGRHMAEREYIGSIVTVVVIILLLGVTSYLVSDYLDQELVLPMERMMSSVEAFARDPLKPLKERSSTRHKETIHLENALIKFGCLLQIAYGEAGAKVISASLNNDSTAENVGKIINGFFGFCDIRNFTDLTEVLQADVVKMVNDVASVVHEAVCFNNGAPNKNIGDAFLLVWKAKKATSASQTAESALRSYISIIVELTRNKELLRFASRHEIQDRIPGFKVRLGFGLHFGWAIECAIGSQRKIDASYLSPHVNMASRLESATKMFGVAILISEATYQLFSTPVQKKCRLIDRVTFKGSVRPMSIYTYDVPFIRKGGNGGTLSEDVSLDDNDMAHEDFFDTAKPHTSADYRHKFERAVRTYLGRQHGDGADWTEAKRMLGECLVEWPEDGAALKLLEFLQEGGQPDRPGEVPDKWEGYRRLDEK